MACLSSEASYELLSSVGVLFLRLQPRRNCDGRGELWLNIAPALGGLAICSRAPFAGWCSTRTLCSRLMCGRGWRCSSLVLAWDFSLLNLRGSLDPQAAW